MLTMVIRTKEELQALTCKDMETILKSLGQRYTGMNKSEMVERILDHQGDEPFKEEDEVSDQGADQELEQEATPNFDVVVTQLSLCDKTKGILADNNFSTLEDLRSLIPADLERLKLPLRDEKAIQRFIGKESKPEVLHVNPGKSATKAIFANTAKPLFFRSAPPSVGESMSLGDEFETSLPQRARDLPRPHTLIQPRSSATGDNLRKVDPLDLTFSEFMAESQRLLSHLVRSQSHSEVASEYSEYLEYLVSRSVDYSSKAVLAFDNEFRNRVLFEKATLNNTEIRHSIADRHFHAATRYYRYQPYPQSQFRSCSRGGFRNIGTNQQQNGQLASNRRHR